MRAVLDANVHVSSLIRPGGVPALVVSRWTEGAYELVVSELLVAEIERVLAFPKLRDRVRSGDADAFVALLRATAVVVPDPPHPPRRVSDPGDDYLLALAERANAMLVSGDRHVLALQDRYPIHAPRTFLDLLEADLAR